MIVRACFSETGPKSGPLTKESGLIGREVNPRLEVSSEVPEGIDDLRLFQIIIPQTSFHLRPLAAIDQLQLHQRALLLDYRIIPPPTHFAISRS